MIARGSLPMIEPWQDESPQGPSQKRQPRAVLTNAGDTAQAAVGWLKQNGSRKVRMAWPGCHPKAHWLH
jgi:hypothetical protein